MRARDNPFSTDRVLSVRFEPQDMGWDELWNRIVQMNFRGAIVGPEGSGKTTLLEDLSPRLREAGYDALPLRLDRENRAFGREQLESVFSSNLPNSIILFDGAEQLRKFAWSRFLSRTRSARGLIITTHRAGLLPTILECRTSPALLGQIVDRLLIQIPFDSQASASLPLPVRRERVGVRVLSDQRYPAFAGEPSPYPSPGVPGEGTNQNPRECTGFDEIARLWQNHRGNVREALREFYDRYSLVPL